MPDPRSTPPRAPTGSRHAPPAPPIARPRPPITRGPRRSWQFSLRFLLAAMTAAALALAALPGAGAVISTFVMPWLALAAPVCLVTAAIYARGWPQTFFIGAAGGAIITALHPPSFTLISSARAVLLAVGMLGTIAMCGALALASRWLVEIRGWNRQPEGDGDEKMH
jgi:hypothetical protein